jgi:hypothetical protein
LSNKLELAEKDVESGRKRGPSRRKVQAKMRGITGENQSEDPAAIWKRKMFFRHDSIINHPGILKPTVNLKPHRTISKPHPKTKVPTGANGLFMLTATKQ